MNFRIGCLLALLISGVNAIAQCSGTATSNASGNWTGSIWTYSGGATTPGNACTVLISAGNTVTVSNNQVTTASVEVRGILVLDSQLRLGTSGSCGQSLRIFGSGQLQGNGASDRLIICGQTVVTGQPSPPAGAISWPVDGGFTASDLGGEGFGFGETGVLPVELLSFYVEQQSKDFALMHWSTASQLNFSHFEIERSPDAAAWSVLHTIEGEGTTNELLTYSYIDAQPLLGKNYYRLRMVDLDQTFEYSPIELVEVAGDRRISLSPNPAADGKTTYHLNFVPQAGTITLYDLTGMELYKARAIGGSDEIVLPSTITAGTYFVR
jgi:hypothetical protein